MSSPVRPVIVASAAVIGMVIALALPGAASAAPSETIEHQVDFVFTQTEQTIEYGSGWSFYGEPGEHTGFVSMNAPSKPPTVTFIGDDAYQPEVSIGYDHGGSVFRNASVWSSSTQPALSPGEYEISVSAVARFSAVDIDISYIQSKPNARLTVLPAALGVELRVLSDPSNRDAAIVTARFTGQFVDAYSSYPGGPLSPGGEWAFEITDERGAVAARSTITAVEGDGQLATSFYWSDAVPEEDYTASVVFTPSGGSAQNFDIAQAPEFDYTAGPQQRTELVSAAETVEPVPDPASSGLALPVWSVALIGVLAAGLAALSVVLIIRFVRSKELASASENGAGE